MQISRKPNPRARYLLAAGVVALTALALVLVLSALEAKVESEAHEIAEGRHFVVVDYERRQRDALHDISIASVAWQALAYELYLPNSVEFGGSSRYREMHFGIRFSPTERYVWSFRRLTFVPAGTYLF